MGPKIWSIIGEVGRKLGGGVATKMKLEMESDESDHELGILGPEEDFNIEDEPWNGLSVIPEAFRGLTEGKIREEAEIIVRGEVRELNDTIHEVVEEGKAWYRNISLKSIVKVVAVLMAFLVIFGFFSYAVYVGWVQIVLEWVQAHKTVGWIVLITIFAMYAIPGVVGYALVAMVTGFLYKFWGMIIIMLGSFFAAPVGFLICRLFLRSYLLRVIEKRPKVKAVFNAVSSHGLKLSIMVRLIPFPFFIQNAIMALSPVGLIKFSIGSYIGLIPEQFTFVYLGASLNQLNDAFSHGFSTGDIILIVFEVVTVSLLILVFFYIGRRAYKKVTREMEEEKKLEALEKQLEITDLDELVDVENYGDPFSDGTSAFVLRKSSSPSLADLSQEYIERDYSDIYAENNV